MRVRTLLFLSTAICTAALGFSQVEGQPRKLKPLIILVETNPWLEVIGSDSPSFALYEKGEVIFLRQDSGYLSVRLDENERKSLIDSLSLGKKFYELHDYYEVFRRTDQPTTMLYVRDEDKTKKIAVYGRIRGDAPARSKTPQAFLKVFDKLVSYQNSRATPWMPEKIEVMVWPFDHSRAEPLPWPKSWPDVNDPTTKRMSQQGYSIYLDSRYFDDLRRLLATLKEGQAVLINGKKWAISYRFPFPHE